MAKWCQGLSSSDKCEGPSDAIYSYGIIVGPRALRHGNTRVRGPPYTILS